MGHQENKVYKTSLPEKKLYTIGRQRGPPSEHPHWAARRIVRLNLDSSGYCAGSDVDDAAASGLWAGVWIPGLIVPLGFPS